MHKPLKTERDGQKEADRYILRSARILAGMADVLFTCHGYVSHESKKMTMEAKRKSNKSNLEILA
jgi:hypothetical protein